MTSRHTFVQALFAGEAQIDQFDDYVETWHESEGDEPIYVFLGLTQEEYRFCSPNPENIRMVLAAKRHDRELAEFTSGSGELALAARSNDNDEFKRLVLHLRDQGILD